MHEIWRALTDAAPFSYMMLPCALFINTLALAAAIALVVSKRRKTVKVLGWLLGAGVAGLSGLYVIGYMKVRSQADEAAQLIGDPSMREALEDAASSSLEPLAWLCGCGNAFPAMALLGLFIWSSLRNEEPSE